MEYRGLEQLRNTYPGDEETVSNSYKNQNGAIKFSGIYPENFIIFDTVSLSDIQLGDLQDDPTISFRFIIEFIDGDEVSQWTSKPFLDDLINAQKEPQPFFSKDRVTIATVDFGKLKKYYRSNKFVINEKYAEVDVTNTLNTKEDIIQHINWIVGSEEEIRPVKTFGDWDVNTTADLGFSYAEQVKQIYMDELDGDAIYDDDIGVSPITRPSSRGDRSNQTGDSTPRGRTNTTEREGGSITRTRAPRTLTNYYPFSTAGNYIGETRNSISTGYTYNWTGRFWQANL